VKRRKRTLRRTRRANAQPRLERLVAGEPGAVKAKAASAEGEQGDGADSQWPLWEVFVQPSQGAAYEHCGSVHAADGEGALQNARDVYARRGEAIGIWVVPSAAIVASKPEDAGPFFDPADDKVYRHPQFYKIPRGLKGF